MIRGAYTPCVRVQTTPLGRCMALKIPSSIIRFQLPRHEAHIEAVSEALKYDQFVTNSAIPSVPQKATACWMQFWKAQTAPLATAQFGASKSFAFESCFASKSHGGHRKSHLNRRLSSPSFNGELLVIQRFNWEGFCMTKSLV